MSHLYLEEEAVFDDAGCVEGVVDGADAYHQHIVWQLEDVLLLAPIA